MGQRGIEYWIKDNKNRLVGHYENTRSGYAGRCRQKSHTYLDIELQQLAEKLLWIKWAPLLPSNLKQAVYSPWLPVLTYDPNSLDRAGQTKKLWQLALDVSSSAVQPCHQRDYIRLDQPINRLGALIGLDEGVITPASGYQLSGLLLWLQPPVKCVENGPGHAANLRLAIAHSCNSFFCNTFRLTVDNP